MTTRYCPALDTKTWTLLGGVFLDDATADLGSPTRLVGLAAITGRIKAALSNLDDSQNLAATTR